MTTRSESDIVVRPARPDDSETLVALLREFLRYEGKAEGDHVTNESVADWAFGPEPTVDLLLAETAEGAVGYVAFYRAFSLFKGERVLLIENLFVSEQARRGGIGRRLVRAAAAEAQRRGYARIELHVRSDNPASLAFYESLGFFHPDEHVYRIEDAALARLAEGET